MNLSSAVNYITIYRSYLYELLPIAYPIKLLLKKYLNPFFWIKIFKNIFEFIPL